MASSVGPRLIGMESESARPLHGDLSRKNSVMWKSRELQSFVSVFAQLLGSSRRPNARRRFRQCPNVESLEIRQLLSADFQLLQDLNNVPYNSSPEHFVKVGATTFFEANGSELWKTDGTEAGTVRVKAFPEAYEHPWLGDMIDGNGILYFAAKEPTTGAAIWKSDGTEAGTQVVKSMSFGWSGLPNRLSFFDNQLFFFARNTDVSFPASKLWKSDGTPEGTAPVSSSNPAPNGYSPLDSQAVRFKGSVYHSLKGPAYSNFRGGLLKTDGSGTTTVRVLSQPQNLILRNNSLYFTTKDTDGNVGLWKSDGSRDGTVQIKQFTPDNFPRLSAVANFTQVNNSLYFTLQFESGHIELWKTDSSSSGTVKVKDIDSDARLLELANSNGMLHFSTTTRYGDSQIWKSDGTEAGTVPVPNPSQGVVPGFPAHLTDVNGTLLFSATTPAEGTELWKLNANGEPVLLKDLNPAIYQQESSNPSQFTMMNGELYFVASDRLHGQQLWKTNGLPGGTERLTSVADGGIDATVIAAGNGRLYFKTKRGDQLWSSDGTIDGTHFVKRFDIPTNVTGTGFGPRRMLNVEGTLFYIATDFSASGWQLWKSDGTEAGTVIVRDSAATLTSVERNVAPVNINGVVYFVAYDDAHGGELWKSDGSSVGTVMVKDGFPGVDGSQPNQLTNVGGTLYFSAYDSQYRWRLWKSDGTANGTVLVNNTVDRFGESPQHLLDHKGTLFYAAYGSDTLLGVWASDGTPEGTKPVNADRNYNFYSGTQLLSAGEFVYFRADLAGYGTELWRTDGTDAGTKMVKDIRPGADSSAPLLLADINGVLYFSADDGVGGRELWKSDGTEAGTVVAFDFTGDGTSSNPSAVAIIVDRVIVAAGNAANGRELFVEDRNSAPTDITLSAASIVENSALGTAIGTFSTVDPDAANTHGYALVAGEGDADNDSFTIVGNMLQTSGSLNFEAKSSHTIRVRTTDQGNRFAEHVFTVSVTNINEAPIAVRLSAGAETLADFIKTSSPVKIADVLIDDDDLGTNVLSLSGADATYFSLVGRQLFLKAGTVLNRQTKPTYSYSIRVDDATVGNSPDASISTQLTITDSYTTINAPGSETSLQRPVIRWTPVGGAAKYYVWIRNSSTNVHAYLIATATTASYTPSSSLGIGKYVVWVRPVGPSGEKAGWSSPYSFRVTTPVSFQPPRAQQSTPKPSLRWDSVPGATKYDLWIDNVSARQSQAVRVSDLRGTSWTSANDLPMGSYRAWVRGSDVSGTAARWSDPVNFMVLPTVEQIGPLTSTFDMTPEFRWVAVPGASTYNVVVRNANTNVVLINESVTSGSTFSPSSSLPVGRYVWNVYAVSSAGFRSPGATTAEFFAGGRPTVLSPLSTTSQRTPQFSWSNVDGAVSYSLFVTRLDVMTTGLINVVGLTSTTYTPSTPLPAGTFRVWARAISSTGALSPWSISSDFSIV